MKSGAKPKILVTGSAGLIGAALCPALRAAEFDVHEFDLQSADPRRRGDVRDQAAVSRALLGCVGVVHLAAISRVSECELHPDVCASTNVSATANIVAAAQQAGQWLLFSSSREVYGNPVELPATEDTPLRPINAYGRSKAEAERAVSLAADAGLHVAIVRLANVYGSLNDHRDRVIPAFVRAAIAGQELEVRGPNHQLDFTHVDDVVRGILAAIRLLMKGISLPPIQLVTGQPTTLNKLAALVVQLARTNAPIRQSAVRAYDVEGFWGRADRAREVLRWVPTVALDDGVARLIEEFSKSIYSQKIVSR